MSKVAVVLVIGALFVIIFLFLQIGVSRTERTECSFWLENSKKYRDYYLTQWQKDQCDSYGISVDAPVR